MWYNGEYICNAISFDDILLREYSWFEAKRWNKTTEVKDDEKRGTAVNAAVPLFSLEV